jgi:hypothetical protein
MSFDQEEILRRARKDAWDEGHEAGRAGLVRRNPYRRAETPEERAARVADEDRRYNGAYLAMPRVMPSWPGPCTCECSRGGFCGGCGHAGCGGRR